jgi:hypothetical protein
MCGRPFSNYADCQCVRNKVYTKNDQLDYLLRFSGEFLQDAWVWRSDSSPIKVHSFFLLFLVGLLPYLFANEFFQTTPAHIPKAE